MTPLAPPSRPVSIALKTLFILAARWPGTLHALRPALARIALRFSPAIRAGIAANARRISAAAISDVEMRKYACRVVENFLDFIIDVARYRHLSADALRATIDGTDGLDAYHACRASRRGAILVTAHMGSFEVGLAALSGAERRVHVVFKRDSFAGFDTLRSELRARLGVNEIAIDDGWPSLFAMRAALERDEVVVLQGDRAMPGQRAQHVPVLGGHLALPLGPVTLARIVGSPIVPVFTVRTAPGRFRVHLLPPIEIENDAEAVDGIDPTLRRIARAIESFIARHPDQWLVLSPAFVEDQSVAASH